MVNVRTMVSFDPVWDPTLTWYERAVAEMQTRAVTDVTSWAYQAAIHGTTAAGGRTSWNTCEHGGWFFFPWHRAYLGAFEDIVRATVVALGGPADWALPYWDYEQPGRDALPPAFRETQNPDGQDNHLFISQRFQEVNGGTGLKDIIGLLGEQAETGLSSASGLSEPTFSGDGSAGAFPFGFGGGPTPSSFQADSPSDIEAQLHGNVHVLVGLGGGLMSQLTTAARDPIFWLHHANIDRLWAQWRTTVTNNDPTDTKWSGQTWTFFTPDRQKKLAHPRDVEDTVGQLGYHYDSVPAPTPGIDAVVGMPDDKPGGAGPRDLEPVGWSDPVTLTGHDATAAVTLDAATLARVSPPGLDAAPAVRPYLELSEIEAPEAPGILYGVYLHAATAAAADDPLVGVVSFFGAPAGRRGADNHRHRLRYVFDLTDALTRLGSDPRQPPAQLTVTFRPLGPAQVAASRGLDAGEPDTPPVSIGRVALVMG
jgi:tyrosinase